MTNEQPACGNDTVLPKRKPADIIDCHLNAVVLAGTLEAIDLMLNEDCTATMWGNAISSVVAMARKQADALANDLDGVAQ